MGRTAGQQLVGWVFGNRGHTRATLLTGPTALRPDARLAYSSRHAEKESMLRLAVRHSCSPRGDGAPPGGCGHLGPTFETDSAKPLPPHRQLLPAGCVHFPWLCRARPTAFLDLKEYSGVSRTLRRRRRFGDLQRSWTLLSDEEAIRFHDMATGLDLQGERLMNLMAVAYAIESSP
mmetsp:Transcript_116646/g.371066  ORF Transcript_116646/g.371066 Transcript_116646/m.371066 type:complete len:176 (+) Transcript_116646:864-1391(+)